MDSVSPEQIKAWRTEHGLSQQSLGEIIGLNKVAISKIEGGTRSISGPEKKLLVSYFTGRPPFLNPVDDPSVYFTQSEWLDISTRARREGFADPYEWVADRIRVFLAMAGKKNSVSGELSSKTA